MLTAALLTALSFAPAPRPHQGWLLAQYDAPPPRPSQSVVDREATLKALRDEKAELEDQKSSIGYTFPIIFIGVGVLGIVAGGAVHTSVDWVAPALLYTGVGIATLSTIWLIYRIVRSISLSHQISNKEDQIEQLEQKRFQPVVGLTPRGGAYLALACEF